MSPIEAVWQSQKRRGRDAEEAEAEEEADFVWPSGITNSMTMEVMCVLRTLLFAAAALPLLTDPAVSEFGDQFGYSTYDAAMDALKDAQQATGKFNAMLRGSGEDKALLPCKQKVADANTLIPNAIKRLPEFQKGRVAVQAIRADVDKADKEVGACVGDIGRSPALKNKYMAAASDASAAIHISGNRLGDVS